MTAAVSGACVVAAVAAAMRLNRTNARRSSARVSPTDQRSEKRSQARHANTALPTRTSKQPLASRTMASARADWSLATVQFALTGTESAGRIS